MRLPTDRAATALARLYAAAEAQLRALVAEAVASGALGTARYRQTRLAEVQRILAELNGEAIPEATQVVADAYTLGGQIAGIEGAFASDVFRREGLRHAALDLIAGGTQRDAAKRLRDALVAQGVSGFRDRAGRDWGLSTYAEMVVRTTTREAVSTATHHTMIEQGSDLVTISSHRGVESDDERCLRIDGKTFSITGRTPGYDVLPLDQWPPMGTHPRCVHVATPAAANLDALERELGLAQPALAAA